MRIVVALVVAGACTLAVAQEQDSKKDCCGAAGILCPKDGKCEGKCREICDEVGRTLKTAQKDLAKLMDKEIGQHCPCMGGECKEDGCSSCATAKDIYKTILKEKVTARFSAKKEASHTVKGDDGKTKEVKCTFLRTKGKEDGDVCSLCAKEIAEAAWKKLKEMVSKEK